MTALISLSKLVKSNWTFARQSINDFDQLAVSYPMLNAHYAQQNDDLQNSRGFYVILPGIQGREYVLNELTLCIYYLVNVKVNNTKGEEK